MWLLSTDRAELHYFARNFDTVGGYAILSHTWTGDEQTLQDVRAIGERCRASGTNPRDDPALSPKIRNCCILAEKHGYCWVWIDSCCIDKTSSSELSEVINSMFRWYKEAEELIAPDFLIFLSDDWHEVGNRADLAELLEEITRVPSRVLTGQYQPAQYSVCTRMFWASRRKTTRVEDEAYCLMGLFGVSIPTNYGEGNEAFIRLQYEIMQRNPDLSLFAFGYCIQQDLALTLSFHAKRHPSLLLSSLLAASPQEFYRSCAYIPDLKQNAKQPYPPRCSDSIPTELFGGVKLPQAAVTSYGIELLVPICETDEATIAVILCQHKGQNIGLFLTRDAGGEDPTRPRYVTGCSCTKPDTGSAQFSARLANLGDDLYNLTFKGKPVKASWQTVYIVPTISDLYSSYSNTPKLTINCNPASRFRIPRWLIAQFTTQKFKVKQITDRDTLQALEIYGNGVVRIKVSFGSCIQHRGHDTNETGKLWAKVDVLLYYADMDTFIHNCSEDHIDSESWATRSKFFGDPDRGVRLSLMPSTRMSESCFVIHLELLGNVLGKMF
ncbi:hypothetical protein GSI_12082 [Ganoderma sinense ZZ0214-1]|uniref:Uncharacterized protein n=1 Tax=Ganoderma sinense ZZ0214-1 TaxID=1077348 RepID=A0A2G8RXT2_9APHY|nr:hypothetical protein GSI_12082 [Ganoderma sinense ZZ0214-1]